MQQLKGRILGDSVIGMGASWGNGGSYKFVVHDIMVQTSPGL